MAERDGTAASGKAALPMSVGERVLLAVNDGEFTVPDGFLGPQTHQALRGPDGVARLPVGSFVLPGDQLTLIDAGVGPRTFGGLRGGQLLTELAAIGVRPEDVNVLALSHLHPDHVGWVATRQEGLTFTNAQIYVAEADWEHFVAEGAHPAAALNPAIRAALLEQAEKGKVTLVEHEGDIVPGLRAMPAPGHTPGHTVYAVHDHGERLLLLGDSIYCAQQMSEMEWEAASDVDPAMARRAREAMFAELESEGTDGVGCHFPGLRAGRVLDGRWIGRDT